MREYTYPDLNRINITIQMTNNILIQILSKISADFPKMREIGRPKLSASVPHQNVIEISK